MTEPPEQGPSEESPQEESASEENFEEQPTRKSAVSRQLAKRGSVNILLGDSPVGHTDVFVPTDVYGGIGAISQFVWAEFGLGKRPELDFTKGWAVWEAAPDLRIIYVVTVGHDPTRQLLAQNLPKALAGLDWHSRSLWIPLMGTGSGQLPHLDSFRITLQALDAWKGIETAHDVIVSVAANTPDKALRRIVEELSDPTPPGSPTLGTTSDAVQLHTDDPSEVDRLGRESFAEAVANHVRFILDAPATSRWGPSGVGSLAIHLDGPWGSGKSTLLKMLGKELRHPKLRFEDPGHRPSWVVVDYNAWEREDEDPPWWSLLNAIYQQGSTQLAEEQRRSAIALRLGEWWRRHVQGRKLALSGIAAAGGAVGAIAFKTVGTGSDQITTGVASAGSAIGTIAALLSTVGKSIFATSAESAKRFASAQSDPAAEIRRHFERLIDAFKCPVAIFLDDLDRCAPAYVVNLLEGVQTLFRSRPVLFVAAADRRWLAKSFQMHYEKFNDLVPSPGHRLGDLFLEKVFQFSCRVPRLTDAAQSDFWSHLLNAGEPMTSTAADPAPPARDDLQKAQTEDEIFAKLAGPDPSVELRQAAVRRLAERDVQERTVHQLQEHYELLPANPRAMKRILNAYSIGLATLVFEGVVDIRGERLVRWLVIEMRWPILADALRIGPNILARNGQATIDEINDAWKRIEENMGKEHRDTVAHLLSDPEVERIVLGAQPDQGVTPYVAERCAGSLLLGGDGEPTR